MSLACHRIGALEIELRLEEEPQARPLMDRIAALREPRLEGVVQRVLDELSPAGRLDRLDMLELDLGPLPLSGFDEAFLARLEQALRQALARQLQGRPPDPPARPVLELLRVFARTGSLPWWAGRRDRTLIGSQIRSLLELAPESWWALVRELQDSPAALERLAFACDEPTLSAVLAGLPMGKPGSEHAVTAPAADLVGERLAAVRGQDAPHTAARLLWLAARGLRGEELRQALVQGDGDLPTPQIPIPPSPAPDSDPATWLRWLDSLATFSDAAGDGGVPAEVLAVLPEPVRAQLAAGWRGETLRRALAEGRQAQPPVPQIPTSAPPAPGSDPATWLRWLDSLATFSDAAGDGGVPAEVLAVLPEPLRTQFVEGWRGETLRRALAEGRQAQPQVPQIPTSAPPAPGSDPATWLRWLDSLATFSDTASDGSLPAEVLAALPEPLRALVAGWRGEHLRRALAEGRPAPPSLPPAPLPPARPLRSPAPGPADDRSASDPAPRPRSQPVVSPSPGTDPADPDELAVDDGGLVILWPFLDTLLSRLELIDPEQRVFLGEEARNQAIALLSFLVEGDPEPPEWRLPLAKVLAGLSPLAPWRLEEPLKPEALAEGERLLEAVIAHAGLAEKVRPEDLRNLVLRRPAVLSSRTGAWLLRVERRAEDALLERLPWGWSWIRLPWMEHPLQVEW
jgi:hypothetical protein